VNGDYTQRAANYRCPRPEGTTRHSELIITHHYVFYFALLFAPWAYGATSSWGIVWLNWILGASLGCWILELLVSRRLPPVRWWVAAVTVAVLVIGWWMATNASGLRDWQYEMFVPRRQIAPGVFGSADYALSTAFMIRVTLLLGVVWYVTDQMSQPAFVLQLWWTIVIAGTSIALLGLLQKATGAEAIFWAHPSFLGQTTKTFFATYFYHANAGAFLNLTWPFAAGLALRSIMRGSHPLPRALLVSCFVIDVVAVMANTSRMAQAVAGVLFLVLLVLLAPMLWKGAQHVPWGVSLSAIAFLSLIVVAIASASQWQQARARWQHTTISQDARWQAAQVGWTMAKRAGLFGWGPGTFRAVFPRFQDATPLDGTWSYLHQDYGQTIIEWGWLGATLWGVLLFGSMLHAAMQLCKNGTRLLPRYRLLVRLALVALAGVAIHALVDFPLQIASIQLYAAVCLGITAGTQN